jgi:tRNA (guanine-N7-)-methyltransferase
MSNPMSEPAPDVSAALTYNPTSFSQGRMDFAWEELSEEDRGQAYADWEAGRGLIGGDPRQRPGSHLLPEWGINQPFFRVLTLEDARGDNGPRLAALLAGDKPLEIEIGYGRGDFLLDRALRHPERLLIGYETKTKATRLMLQRIERVQARPGSVLADLWLSDDDARFNLPRVIDNGRVYIFHILFPDPWWKTQHIVKRLFSPPFVDLLAAKLKPGGLLHFKSDVQEYGELVRYLVEGRGAFEANDPMLAERIGPSAPTHREHWCQVHGKPVYAYYFIRK